MFNIITKECKELISNNRIWIFIMTVLIIFIIGTSYNTKNPGSEETDRLKLGIVNKDTSAYSELLVSYIENNETISAFLEPILGEEETLKSDFNRGHIDLYIEIPEDFAKNMIRIQHVPITVLIDGSNMAKAIIFQNVLASYEKYISAVEANAVGLYEIMEQDGMSMKLIDDTNRVISLDLIFTALGKDQFFQFNEIQEAKANNLLEYYLYSIITIIILYLGVFAGVKLLEEYQQGTLDRLRITGMPLWKVFLGKTLVLFISMTVVGIIIATLMVRGDSFWTNLLFVSGLTGFSLTFSMALSGICKSRQSYVVVINMILFYFILMGGGLLPMMYLPQSLLRVGRWTPFYHMMEGWLEQSTGEYNVIANLGWYGMSVILFISSLWCYQRRERLDE